MRCAVIADKTFVMTSEILNKMALLVDERRALPEEGKGIGRKEEEPQLMYDQKSDIACFASNPRELKRFSGDGASGRSRSEAGSGRSLSAFGDGGVYRSFCR